ncbi:Phosphoenolpyruvate/pyruvate domain-containing protein [Coniochaeta ligniaria NRRL 30616]|uniref:Phosphoenolpyruvate/pyruvate domain-containing protein n=1 Tax=Coniochaeta ligniaria NRRL 30616 TaxID=1408157 RepID=A0A1J7J4V5_9PEZI|nr:Phosphoenolpyruvate/pyruvate domain-containing protein [Coniochaeta ligniaria NRRL 30616]
MPPSSTFRIVSSFSSRCSCNPRLTLTSHTLGSARRSFAMAAATKMIQANRLRRVFTENKGPSMGFWQMLPGANISRALARAGADWIMVDCEHGCMDDRSMHEAVSAIAAVGVSPIVRIPDMQSWMIKRALDSGAHGILVPLIRTVEEVKGIVRNSKFPPEGQRGFGSPFSMQNFDPMPTMTEYLQQANSSLLTMVQIETQEALDVVDEIAPLVDVLFVGPFDLGNNIGHPVIDGVIAPELEDAIRKVLAATKKADKRAGIYSTSGEQANPQVSRVNSVILQDCRSRLQPRAVSNSSVATTRSTTPNTLIMAQKCVHQGCGKIYTDADEVCKYHPGPPVFHEGQKGWKCCKPRVLTFEEFMSIPPCTEGKHSTTDLPPKIEKKEGAEQQLPEQTTSLPPPPPRGPITVGQVTSTPPPPQPESEDDDPSLEIPDGRTCRRRGCGAVYDKGKGREAVEGEKCVHHPGVPIFHEGSKGYSCCKRRVLEFDQFMKIEGCKTKDRHLFVGSGKEDAEKARRLAENGGEEVLDTVRHDFYQTPSSVIASFFLKKIDKDRAKVAFREPQELDLDLPTTDAPTPKRYRKAVSLWGPIDAAKSSFKILGTKLEVTLAKADGSSWPVLRSEDRATGEILQVGRAGRVQ